MIPQASIDRWYYAREKKKMGPVSAAQLRWLLAEGVLKPDDMVLQEGTAMWRSLAQVAGARARHARRGGLWRLAVGGGGGLVLLALLGWGLGAMLHGPNGNEEFEDFVPVAETPGERAPANVTNAAAEPRPLTNGDHPPLLAASQERPAADSGLQPALVVQITSSGAGLWDTATGKKIRDFPGRTSSVAFSPDGKQVLMGAAFSPDGKQVLTVTARLWDAASGKEIRAFAGHTGPVTSIAFSPDGKQVLTGSKDDTARLWDVASGEEIRSFRRDKQLKAGGFGILSVAFSPDGKRVLTYGGGGTARIWDAASGKEIRAFEQRFAVECVAFSPDGMRIVAASGGAVQLWNADNGNVLHTLKHKGDYHVKSAAFSPDGKQVVTGSGNNTARLWDAVSGKEIRAFHNRHGPATFVAFSPDGKQVLGAGDSDSAALVWDAASGREIRAFQGYTDYVGHVAFSGDGKQMLTTGGSQDKTARLWNAVTGKQIRSLRGHTGSISSVAFSPDGKQILTGSGNPDRTARLWDAASGKEVRTLRGFSSPVDSVAFSPDAKQLLTASGKTTRLWDAASGKEIRAFPGARPAGFSPDGTQVFTVSEYFTAQFWNTATGEEIAALQEPKKYGGVFSLAFSPDGKHVLTGCDRTAQMWDAATGKHIRGFPRGAAPVVGFSPDGKQVFTADRKKALQLWDAASGKEIASFEGHEAGIGAAAISPDGKHLLTGSFDGTARLWAVASGRELIRLISFLDGSGVAMTPDFYYNATKGNLQGLAYRLGLRAFPFDQFDLKFNRPDKVVEAIGLGSPEMVSAYKHAWQKRIKRMGFTEDKFSNDFHLPEVAVGSGAPAFAREKTLTLKVHASDSRYLLDRLHVDVNGVPLHGAGGICLRQQASKTWERDVEIELSAGANKIVVSVVNEQGTESLKETVSIHHDTPPKKPNLYVVAVGVSDYHDVRFRLTYADKDARDLAELFESRRDRFGEVKALRILNRDATRENIIKGKDFLKDSHVDDIVVLFFAGHGLLDNELDYYFATTDVDFKNPADRGLPYAAIEDLLEGSRARKKLLFMDTCHSGELDKKEVQVAKAAMKPADEIKVRTFRGLDLEISSKVGLGNSYQLLQEMFADLRRGTGAVVIASAGGAEFAMESVTWKNGVFTHALIRGLKGEANQKRGGRVRVSKLRDFMEQEVRRLTAGRQSPTARRDNFLFDFTLDTAQALQAAHARSVHSVAFAPDGKQVLTAGGGKARLWDTASGQEIRAFIGHTAAFSPDGKQVLTAASVDMGRIWDAASGKAIRDFRGHTGILTSMVFSPDGKQVLTGSYDHTARLWDAANGKEIHVFRHGGFVSSVAFSPDGKQVLTGSRDNTARLWDAASGTEIHAFKNPGFMSDLYTFVSSVAFSPDGKQVLTGSGDNTARLRDAASGQQTRAFGQQRKIPLNSVAFSPDGARILTGSRDNTARLWDVASGAEIRIFDGHTGSVNTVAFSPDGTQVLTGSEDKSVRLWDAASGKEIREFVRILAGPPPAVSAVLLPVGSIWQGEKHRNEGNKRMPATLTITERDGASFKGQFRFDQNNVNAVMGTISGAKIEWRTTKVLQGSANQPTTGTLKDNTIEASFKLVTRKGKQALTATGTIKLIKVH
jgi:WD40 repeat protein